MKKSGRMPLKIIKIAIVMGSKSDLPTMKAANDALKEFGLSAEMKILSAHRTPQAVAEFATKAHKNGYQIIIAGAGGAAHLPGMIASYTELPVIGVPVDITPLQGTDALFSIVQMPKGIPVATVAIGNAWNAGLLAVQMIACSDLERSSKLFSKIRIFKQKMKQKVLKN